MSRERAHQPIPRNRAASPRNEVVNMVIQQSNANITTRRTRGFGHQPIIESSASPAPSDVASVRSTGTNRSNGTTFFRNYVEAHTSLRQDVMTPDLIFAEIGHGRGTGPVPGPSNIAAPNDTQRNIATMALASSTHSLPNSTSYLPMRSSTLPNAGSLPHLAATPDHPHPGERPLYRTNHRPVHRSSLDSSHYDRNTVLVDASNSFRHSPGHSDISHGWTPIARDGTVARSLSPSPSARELQESVHSALGHQNNVDGRDVDDRGRSVKRSLRNTITAAEQYASSFFFTRNQTGSSHDGMSGPSNFRESDSHGH